MQPNENMTPVCRYQDNMVCKDCCRTQINRKTKCSGHRVKSLPIQVITNSNSLQIQMFIPLPSFIAQMLEKHFSSIWFHMLEFGSFHFSHILRPKGHTWGRGQICLKCNHCEVWNLCGFYWADKWLMSDWVSQQAHMTTGSAGVSDDNQW